MPRVLLSLFSTTVILLLAASGSTSLAVAQPGAAGADALISTLRASGLELRQIDRIMHAFFTVPATVYETRAGELQIYEYPTAELAMSEAAKVSADGLSIGTSKVFWIAPPHFFRDRAIILLYLGSDRQTLDLLRAKIGPQFAGS